MIDDDEWLGEIVTPLGNDMEIGLSPEEISHIEHTFVVYTHETGPIVTTSHLFDLLHAKLPHLEVSRAELPLLSHIWTDGHGSLSMKTFVSLIIDLRRIRCSKGRVRVLSKKEASILFEALGCGDEFVHTSLLSNVCSALERDSFSASNTIEYTSLEGFMRAVREDLSLSRRLAIKFEVLVEACHLAELDESEWPIEDDDYLDAASEKALKERILEEEDGSSWLFVKAADLASLIKKVRTDIHEAASTKALSRLQSEFNHKAKRKRVYFSSQHVVPTTGAISASSTPALVHGAPTPSAALDNVSKSLTAHAFVSRMTELKRLRQSSERQEKLKEESLLDSANRSTAEDGRSIKLPSRAPRNKLFPHALPPQESIKKFLGEKLGVEYECQKPRDCGSLPTFSRAYREYVPKVGHAKPRVPSPSAFFFASTREMSPNFDSTMPLFVSPGIGRRRQKSKKVTRDTGSDVLHEVSTLLVESRRALVACKRHV